MQSRLFAIARALVVSTLFVSIWTYFMPRWFASSRGVTLAPHWNAAAIALFVIGGLIMAKCVWDFAWTGRGTPAPFDPPRRLVVSGLYLFVRNPMYIGMGLVLVGEMLLWPQIARELVILVIVLWALINGFVMLYEEPHLRDTFGDDYVEYCRSVRRWVPRLTPFDKETERTVTSLNLD
jgi:protein-S-isoprenylcysteine O-methyltransferase Ste14